MPLRQASSTLIFQSFFSPGPWKSAKPFTIAQGPIYSSIRPLFFLQKGVNRCITWSSAEGEDVRVTPKWGCSATQVHFQLTPSYWTNLFINQAWAFSSSIRGHRCELRERCWPGLGGWHGGDDTQPAYFALWPCWCPILSALLSPSNGLFWTPGLITWWVW